MQPARAPRAPTNRPASVPPRPAQTPRVAPAARAALAQSRPPAVRLSTLEGPRPSAGPGPAGLPAQVAQLVNSPGSGEPLLPHVRAALESSLEVPLYPVRVHADPRTAAAVDGLGARAFTYGLHVFLGPRERPNDLALMAHEVAHVVQQQGRPILQMHAGAAAGDAFEREAEHVAGAAQRGERVTVRGRTGGAQVQGTWPVDDIAGWVQERVWGLLNEHAPQLVPILRQGVVEWLKGRLGAALQSVFDELSRPVRAVRDVASAVGRHFGHLIGWLREAGAKIARNDCGPISEAAEKIQQVFEGLTAPVVDRVKHFAEQARGFFRGLWERFGAPVWDFLRRIGGAVWEQIQRIGRWVWEQTQPVRDLAGRAWRWFKNWLGIGQGEEGHNGVLQWFQRKAGEAWNWLLARLAPFRRPLMVVAGVLVMLSPAGPIIAIGGAAAGIIRGVQWIRQHFRTRDGVVRQQGFLRGTILPAILGAINAVSGVVRNIANQISGALNRAVGGVDEMASAVGGVPFLSFAGGLIGSIAETFRALANWASEGVQGLAGWVQSGLNRLGGFARTMADLLEEVARVVANVMRLVYFLGGRLWNAIPACIRDPFIDFFIPLILRQIPFFRELAATPEAWSQTRADVMLLIRQFFRDLDLMGAMRSAFRLLLRALRVPADLALQVLQKAARSWDVVLASPVRFLQNLLRTVARGFSRFFGNVLSHLWYGVQGWLFNQLGDIGITPPSNWNLEGVFRLILQVSGVTLDHVLELLARRVGRPVVDRIRRAISFLTGAWEWVRVAITEGPAGLWRMLAGRLSDLGRMVLESVVGWVMQRIIAQVSVRLTALFASAGLSAVVESFRAFYNAIQTALEYARRILEILNTIFDTILQIARGVFDPAAEMLERGLRMAMPVVIGFLANFLGLGGLGERIRETIMGVRERVDTAILWLIDRALAAGRWLLDRLQAGVAAVVGWWRARVQFGAADGETHSLYFEGSERSARLTVASVTPVAIEQFLDLRETEANDLTNALTANERAVILRVVPQARGIVTDIQTNFVYGPPSEPTAAEAQINQRLRRLSVLISPIMTASAGPVPPMVVVPGFSASKATGLNAKFIFHGPGNHYDGTESDVYTNAGGTLSGALPHLQSLGIRTNWVAFHIINHRVGGLAVDSNLIPTPRDVNGDYLDEFEAPMITAHNTIPVWMNAQVSYYRADLRFVENLRVTGGRMKWERNNQRWVEDTRSSMTFPTFSRRIDLPRANVIYINRLPADPAERAVLLRGSRLTAAMVDIIVANVSTRIESKEDIIGILRNYVFTLQRANDPERERTMNDFSARVRDTNIDFSP